MCHKDRTNRFPLARYALHVPFRKIHRVKLARQFADHARRARSWRHTLGCRNLLHCLTGGGGVLGAELHGNRSVGIDPARQFLRRQFFERTLNRYHRPPHSVADLRAPRRRGGARRVCRGARVFRAGRAYHDYRRDQQFMASAGDLFSQHGVSRQPRLRVIDPCPGGQSWRRRRTDHRGDFVDRGRLATNHRSEQHSGDCGRGPDCRLFCHAPRAEKDT